MDKEQFIRMHMQLTYKLACAVAEEDKEEIHIMLSLAISILLTMLSFSIDDYDMRIEACNEIVKSLYERLESTKDDTKRKHYLANILKGLTGENK